MRQKPFQITTTPKRCSVSHCSDKGSLKHRGRSSGRSSGKSLEQNELASIRNTLDYLVKEVKNLKANSQFSRSSLRAASVTPVPPGGYDSRRILLEKMNNEQFKNFRDEVIQILRGFDNFLSIDHTQKWNDICDHVFKDIMPAVNQALTGLNLFIIQKKERRKRGISYMYNMNDENLVSLRPQSLPEETFKEDIAEIIDNSHYHSDEMEKEEIFQDPDPGPEGDEDEEDEE
ncbi:5669_t:CDS:2 [Funneliformis caledonium]|uniref:5669_t:CDS:1 n=1 Tax=Funneliformis caledonium TaxID=1117310 RepID=A0A9N9GDB4_9GLOM|nr:5669_t:CDS:2 [Funneliformis caledonium]